MTIVDRRHEFADVNYKEVHDIIFPADVRTTDNISARLMSRGSDLDAQSVRVWKISPLGVEILVPDAMVIAKGDQIDLQLQIGRQSTVFEGLIVDVISSTPGGQLAGIRLSGKKPSRFGQENRRKATRWQCSSQFYPVATCANPVEFNDFIYLRLKDISSIGFRAITSLRNKFLVPGMKLSLQVSFPTIGYSNIDVEISRANLTAEDGKDYLELGLTFDELEAKDRETLGQYLIQFSDAESLASIRQQGLYPNSLVAGLDYSFVKTEQDFRETLALRHSANREVGKISSDTNPDTMSDMFDARSRIINWHYRGDCVGTVRTTFCENNETLELEEFIDLPREFPRRDQIAEIGRAATHPSYRRGDLFSNLLQRVALLCLQSKRTFAVISTTEELVSMYCKVGLTDSKITYVHPLYPEKTQHVLYADVPSILSGEDVGPFAWNLIWNDVLNHVIETGIIPAKDLVTSKVRIYRFLSPLTLLAKYFMKKPRKATKKA